MRKAGVKKHIPNTPAAAPAVAPAATAAASVRQPGFRYWWLLVPVLLLITWLAYHDTLQHGFTNWDDKSYVNENKQFTAPADTRLNVIFGSKILSSYNPLTVLTFAWNYDRAQLNPEPYHRTNVWLHLLDTALVAWLVWQLSRKWLAALFCAAVFALHPAHVEAVAWVSARKDVLYGFFYLLSLLLYGYFLPRQSRGRRWLFYGLSVAALALSLLAKPQAVTLPAVLLLLDYYHGRSLKKVGVWLEKLPFAALAVASGIITVYGADLNASSGEVESNLWEKLLLSAYALVLYLYKFFLPLQLSAIYPFPDKSAASYGLAMYGSLLAVLALTFLLWRFRQRLPHLFFGYGFFVLTISIVLHLIGVNSSPIYERFTYLPYLGLAYPLGVGLSRWWERSNAGIRAGLALGLLLLTGVLANAAHQRSLVWKDSLSLWNDVVAQYQGIFKAWNNRGDALNDAKRYPEAIEDLTKSLALRPGYYEALYNRGLSYYYLQQYPQAIADYTEAIRYKPDLAQAYYNRSGTYFTIQQFGPALQDARKAQQLGHEVDPRYFEALEQGLQAQQK